MGKLCHAKKTLSEINSIAVNILCEKIGLVNTIRFINLFSKGYGNYTEERDQLFGKMTLNDAISEIKKTRKND